MIYSRSLVGPHKLPDGSTASVAVSGPLAEVRGTDKRGEASFTVVLPVDEAAALIGAAS